MAKIQVVQRIGQTIKQVHMRQALDRRLAIETIKRQLKDEEGTLKALEERMMEDVKAGVVCENGALTCGIATTSSVRPKWKEVFAERLGAEAVEEVISQTEPSVVEKLTILKAPRG